MIAMTVVDQVWNVTTLTLLSAFQGVRSGNACNPAQPYLRYNRRQDGRHDDHRPVMELSPPPEVLHSLIINGTGGEVARRFSRWHSSAGVYTADWVPVRFSLDPGRARAVCFVF